MKEKKQRQQKLKREHPIIRVLYYIFWAMIVVLFTAFIFYQADTYNALRAELNEVNLRIEREIAEREELEFHLSFFDSDAYIEQLARNVLGMVRPNEFVFRNIAE